MPPYGHPNYDFPEYEEGYEIDKEEAGVDQVTLWYLVVLVSMLLIWMIIFFCLRILTL
ncbi:jg19120, partial [Pararge aegeria aegeria]